MFEKYSDTNAHVIWKQVQFVRFCGNQTHHTYYTILIAILTKKLRNIILVLQDTSRSPTMLL